MCAPFNFTFDTSTATDIGDLVTEVLAGVESTPTMGGVFACVVVVPLVGRCTALFTIGEAVVAMTTELGEMVVLGLSTLRWLEAGGGIGLFVVTVPDVAGTLDTEVAFIGFAVTFCFGFSISIVSRLCNAPTDPVIMAGFFNKSRTF